MVGGGGCGMVQHGPFLMACSSLFGPWAAASCACVLWAVRVVSCRGAEMRTSEHSPSLAHSVWGFETVGFRARQHRLSVCAFIAQTSRLGLHSMSMPFEERG